MKPTIPFFAAAAILAACGAARADGEIRFTLTIMTANALTAFYVSGATGPETNVLSGSIEPQGSADIAIAAEPDQCLRHFRIVFSDNTEQQRSDVDICNIDGYVVE
jgi:hypothetical protein